MKLEADKKTYLSLVVFAGGAIPLTALVIFPLVNSIRKDSQELYLQRESEANFLEEKHNLQKFINISEEIEANLEKADDLLIDPDIPLELVGLSNFIENTAVDSDVSVKISSLNFDPGIKEGQESKPYLSFNIESWGRFSSFMKFIEKLENSFYLIEVKNLNMRRAADQSVSSDYYGELNQGDIIASLSIRAYTK